MGYRLENKDINLNEKKFTKIAQGKTGNVFKCNGYAIKVFNNYAEDIIDLEKLAKEFETWKKKAKEKINDMKKGKLTENEVYDWILKNK